MLQSGYVADAKWTLPDAVCIWRIQSVEPCLLTVT